MIPSSRGARGILTAGLSCLLLAGCAPREAHVGGALVLLLVAHVWLCATAFALPRAWGAPARTAAAIVVLGLTGYAVFWAYFFSAAAGPGFVLASLFAPALAAVLTWWLRRHDVARQRADVAAINAVALPSLALAGLVLWAGLYPFDWEGTDWATPALRWRDMPVDNWLPYMVAEMMAEGRIISPMLEEWLTSDRPPLQSGISLLFSPLIVDHPGLAYQVSSSWAQSLVLVPLAALLALLPTARSRAIALAVTGLSAVVFLNTLFVWPKLLAAAYCAMYHLLLFGGRRGVPVTTPRLLAAGLVAALALLSHGGATFALAGSTIAFLVAKRWRAPLYVAAVAGASIVTYLPWVLYQRLVDPPGDRLLKWHFAGQIDVTERSTPQVLADAYAALPPGAWWPGRIANFDAVASGATRFHSDVASLASSILHGGTPLLVRPMVEASFFSTAYSTWFFSLLLVPAFAVVALLRRAPVRDMWPPDLFSATLVSLAIWILTSFIPGSTIVHAGAYFNTIAILVIAMVLAAFAARPVFYLLAIGNLSLGCALYVFDHAPRALPSPTLYAVVAGLLVLAFVASCLHGQRTSAPRPITPGTSA